MKIPNFIETETEYYTIQYWIDKTSMGKHIENAYKTAKRALKKQQQMFDTGKYQSIMVRKETVYKRNEHFELSTSTPFRLLERQV